MTGAHKSIYSRDKFANKVFFIYIALMHNIFWQHESGVIIVFGGLYDEMMTQIISAIQ